MGAAALSGNDTLTINGRVITDLADADAVTCDPKNDSAAGKTGKNSNTIFSQNMQGNNYDVKLRVLVGSDDDKFLNGLYASMKSGLESFVLMNGEFVKKIGDGKGNIKRATVVLSGGIFTRPPNVKTNADGDTEQSIAVWSMFFANGDRVIE